MNQYCATYAHDGEEKEYWFQSDDLVTANHEAEQFVSKLSVLLCVNVVVLSVGQVLEVEDYATTE